MPEVSQRPRMSARTGLGADGRYAVPSPGCGSARTTVRRGRVAFGDEGSRTLRHLHAGDGAGVRQAPCGCAERPRCLPPSSRENQPSAQACTSTDTTSARSRSPGCGCSSSPRRPCSPSSSAARSPVRVVVGHEQRVDRDEHRDRQHEAEVDPRSRVAEGQSRDRTQPLLVRRLVAHVPLPLDGWCFHRAPHRPWGPEYGYSIVHAFVAWRAVWPSAAATAASSVTVVSADGRENQSARKPITGGPRSIPP